MRGNRTNTKRSDLSNNILIITLHINDPNITIKRQEIFRVDFKNYLVIYCQQETHLLWKWKDGKEYTMQTVIKIKKAWVYTLIFDKTDYRTNNIIRDKERCHVMIKVPIHQEEGRYNDSKCSCISYSLGLKQFSLSNW